MALPTPAVIDLTEFVYDLDVARGDWVPSLLDAGRPLFDHGEGVVATTYMRPPEGGRPVPDQFFLGSGAADIPDRLWRLSEAVDAQNLREVNRSGVVSTLSAEAHRVAGGLETLAPLIAPAQDLLAITAVDPNGVGLSISALLPSVTTLKGRDLELWQMIGAHLVTGFRLRQSIEEGAIEPAVLPNSAEAVLDPTGFRIVEAIGRATEGKTGEFIREAARAIDRARGPLRKKDPEEALQIWKALVDGRWSMVDWFDSDGRRFVLAHPNPPDLKDPRGLNERERQVAAYASLGESNKLISYRLGLSQSQVSAWLKSAMHKLGVKTRPQLIATLRSFEPEHHGLTAD